MTVTSAETTNIEAARTFFTTLAKHLQHLHGVTGTNRAALAGQGLDATILGQIDAIGRQLDAIAGTCTAGAEHLTDYHGGLEQAVNNTAEAADTDFYRQGTGQHSVPAPAEPSTAPAAAAPVAPARDVVPDRLQLGDAPDAPVVDWSGGDITGPRTLALGQGDDRAAVQMRRSELADLVDALDKLGQFRVSYNEMPLAAGGSVHWTDWDQRQDGSLVTTLSVADDQGGFGFVELNPRQVAELSRSLQRQLDADGEARDRAAGIKPGDLNPDDLLYDDKPDTYAAAAKRHRQTADWYATLDQSDRGNVSQKAWFTKAADTLDAAAARQASTGQEG